MTLTNGPRNSTLGVAADRPLHLNEQTAFGSAGGAPSQESMREAEALGGRLADEMAAAWSQGIGLTADELLGRFPQLTDHPQVAVRLIYEEFCLRQEAGEQVDTAEILNRFPQWRAELEVLLVCHDLMQAAVQPPDFPQPGEKFGEFHLLAELGRGGMGRVFLATQPALSDRPVVLKLTPCSGGEHLSLARLQHTAIVPLLLVRDFPERNLRAMCMPYWGGMSLARCLARLQDSPEAHTGRSLVEALAQAPAYGLPAFQGPVLKFLAGLSYADAICWIGACLADGLHYAHQRGLMHLDVKPSNVLLSGDGQPMLLDFHLAQKFIRPGDAAVESLGGSLGYMSPEQQQALAALRTGRRLGTTVDGRSDIYGLGVVLYEALSDVRAPGAEHSAAPAALRWGGAALGPSHHQFCSQPHSRLSRVNPRVSRGLSDIIQKCLADDPRDRYQDAAALAEDLRRHLANRPLRGVPNRSLAERWRKWRRRQPHRLHWAGFLIVAALAAVGYCARQGQTARSALAAGRDQMAGEDYEPAIDHLQRGLDAIRWAPGWSDVRHSLTSSLAQAEHSLQAENLHAIVDQLRLVYGMESLPDDELRQLETASRRLWNSHRELLQRNRGTLNEYVRRQLETDLLDLAILSADLRVRLAADPADARRLALKLLDEAEAAFGTNAILQCERRKYAAALGPSDEETSASDPTPQTAWEHYALGRSLLRDGRLEQAAEELEQSIHLEPQSWWASFYYATCAHRLGRYQEAVGAWNACVALEPANARCYYNRGLAYRALSQQQRVRRDFDKARSLDATLSVPALDAARVGRAR